MSSMMRYKQLVEIYMSGSGHMLTPEMIGLTLYAMEEYQRYCAKIIWSTAVLHHHHGHLVRRVTSEIQP